MIGLIQYIQQQKKNIHMYTNARNHFVENFPRLQRLDQQVKRAPSSVYYTRYMMCL